MRKLIRLFAKGNDDYQFCSTPGCRLPAGHPGDCDVYGS